MKAKNIITTGFYFLFLTVFISCNNGSSEREKSETTKINVAIFNGNGASAVCILETYESLKIDTGITAGFISAREISEGKLTNFDVVIFPGGSASKELNNLGQSGAEKVLDYVKSGHGVVGICAGGYLFSTTKGYPSLRLVSATEWDRAHYDKGRALVEFELTAEGENVFPELADKKCFLQYYDGPVLMAADSGKSNIQNYNEYGKFVTDIQIHKGYPAGITPGKTFLLSEKIEEGRAIVVAGHPESTPGMRWMVARLARWAAKEPLVSYNPKWVRPDIYSTEILFKPELVKKEKDYFWNLLSESPELKIAAMQNLWEMHSRPAVRWNMGLLRDTSAPVRAKAAVLLKQAEYSDALPDLKIAFEQETDAETKSVIKASIDFLSEY